MEYKSYKTVGEPGAYEFVEKRSRFIGYCRQVTGEPQAAAFVSEIRAKHKDASHNVPAYVIREGNLSRCSDDGEPSGSAGVPVLQAIAKREIVDCAVVVARYFGGVLLGAGGLVRAYTKAAAGAIDAAGIVVMTPCDVFSLMLDYPLYEQVLRLLESQRAKVLDTAFTDRVAITIMQKTERCEELYQAIRELSGGAYTPERLETRFAGWSE